MDKNYKLLTLIIPLMAVKRNLSVEFNSFTPIENILYGIYTGKNLIFNDNVQKKHKRKNHTGRNPKEIYN